MQFSQLCTHFNELETTASRNAMTEQLAELFKNMSPEEASPICYLSLGRLRPLFDRLDFQLADKMIVRSLAQAFDQDIKTIARQYKDIGDIGEVAEQLAHTTQANKTVTQVYEELTLIAKESGAGSQDRKVGGLANLLTSVDAKSAKYIVRIILGKLRLGFSDKTILDALSVMDTGSKQGRKELDKAYQVFPDVGTLAGIAKKHGTKDIASRVSVTLGVPVIPALAQRLKTPEEMIKKMGEVIVEPKYDGTRVQIHIRLGKAPILKTFTRNLDETTHMFPELQEGLSQLDAKEVILDSEAVGVHPKTGKLLPFQATITRKRKHGIEDAARQVPLKFFLFDILYLDGKNLLELPLSQRRQILEKVVKPGAVLEIDPATVAKDPEVLRKLHHKFLADKLEGAVIKKLSGEYKPGRQGWNWVKFKEVETAAGKLADTLDCLVMGYYRGKGKRTQFGIGAFLVGIRNAKTSEYQTIAKVGTGLTDDQWRELKSKLESEVSGSMPGEYLVDKSLVPDIWVHPAVVVEIAADEITNSPNHSSGVALRFPRLVKFRDDKSPAQTTSLQEVLTIQKNST